jgi:hypothetical protein
MSALAAPAPTEAPSSTEQYLSTAEVAKRLHRSLGIRVSTKAINRWIFDGVSSLVTEGEKINLRADRFGGRFYVKWSWVEEFLEATKARRSATPHVVSPAARDRATRAAEMSLKRKGYRA